ncbi:MAG: amino acid adenylation domain-containing protein [Christensenellaceae bacterium]|jgi:amino acid adenylation domain-containing protein
MRQTYPLSLNQTNIWNLELAIPGTSMNNICETIRIKGRLDIPLLQKTLNLVIASDLTLRTRIILEEDTPKQYYVDAEELTFPIYDFSRSQEDGFAHFEAAISREAMRLLGAPLFSFYLFRLGEAEGGVILKTHHLISDGWSQVALGNQIATTYLALLNEETPEFAEKPSYTRYIEKEQEYLRSNAYQKDMAYWEAQFAKNVVPVALKEVKGAEVSPVGHRKTFQLPDVLNNAVYAFCEQNRVSPFSVFYMALAIYLKRMTGESLCTIGVPIFNRADVWDRQTTGMFVSTLPFIGEVDENWDFNTFNLNLADQWYDMLRHQKLPFGKIGEIARAANGEAEQLFHVVLSYQNGIVVTNEETSISFSGQWHYSGYQKEQLCVHVSNVEDVRRYVVSYDYLTQFFGEEEIERLHQYLCNILLQALENPNKPISEISPIGIAEKEQVVFRFNDSFAPRRERNVFDAFSEVLKEHKNRVAIIAKGERYTYEHLAERANAYAAYILGQGHEKGVVAITLEKDTGLIAAMVGTVQAGHAWVLLPPELPEKRIAELLQDSGAALWITTKQITARIETGIPTLFAETPLAAASEVVSCHAKPADTVYIAYTSGSTGMPKGVEITHKNLLNLAEGIAHLYGHGAVLSVCNTSFDVFVMESMASLLNGRTIVLPTKEEEENPGALAKLIQNYAVGLVAITPSRLSAFMKAESFRRALRRLECIICGGEAPSGTLLQELQNFTHAKIYNQYGPSETTVAVSYKLLNETQSITIGKPMENCRLYVLDEHLHPRPIGMYGEIYIGGACVGNGYHNREDLTKEAFIDSPFVHGEKIYRTGDMGCWTKEGEIMLAGRRDDQVKIRGLRIELQEISARLAAHPTVSQAVVRVIAQDERQVIVAYYTAEKEIGEMTLLEFMIAYLPTYMVPARFVYLEKIPLTPNGKIDYAALPLPAQEQAWQNTASETELQEKIVAIFKKILKTEEIGVDSDYFIYGGDSLNALETLSEIELEIGMRLRIADLVVCRTARKLEALLEKDASAQKTEKQRAPEKESYPLTPAQQSIYIESLMAPQSFAYHMPGAFRMPRGLSVARLEAAIKAVVAAEPVFHFAFTMENGIPVQKVNSEVEITLEILQGESFAVVAADFVKPFDLTSPPLLRVGLWEEAAGEPIFFIDLHHLISDGLSSVLLMQKIDAAYQGNSVIEEYSYLDYAYAWETKDAAAEQEEIAHWVEKTKLVAEPLDLPTDYPRPRTFDYAGDIYTVEVDAAKREDYETFCKKQGISLYSLLAGAYGILLQKIAGNEAFFVGTPVAGRNHAYTTKLLGLFMTALPLYMAPEKEKQIDTYLQELNKTVQEMLDHGEVFIARIITEAGLARASGGNPLYQVMFSLRPMEETVFSLDGTQLAYLPIPIKTAKLDLSLEAAKSKTGGLSFAFEYATALFTEETIALYARSYTALLDAMVQNAQQNIDMLMPISAQDYYTLIEKPNRIHVPYAEIPLDQQIDQMARIYPAAPAIICEGRTLSFAALKERSDRLAGHLQKNGAQHKDHIALMTSRREEMLIALIAIAKAGCAYVPILSAYPEARISYMLENAEASLLLCDEANLAHVPENTPCPVIGFDDAGAVFTPVAGRSAEDLLYILYTSGSTGQPKGVMLPHKALSNLFISIEKEMQGLEGPILCTTNIVFDIFITETLLPLAMGKCVVLANDEEMMLPWKMAELIRAYGVGFVQFTPSRLQMCLSNEIFYNAMAEVALIILVGEALGQQLLESLQNTGNIRILNMYGPTEAAVYVTVAI